MQKGQKGQKGQKAGGVFLSLSPSLLLLFSVLKQEKTWKAEGRKRSVLVALQSLSACFEAWLHTIHVPVHHISLPALSNIYIFLLMHHLRRNAGWYTPSLCTSSKGWKKKPPRRRKWSVNKSSQWSNVKWQCSICCFYIWFCKDWEWQEKTNNLSSSISSEAYKVHASLFHHLF